MYVNIIPKNKLLIENESKIPLISSKTQRYEAVLRDISPDARGLFFLEG